MSGNHIEPPKGMAEYQVRLFERMSGASPALFTKYGSCKTWIMLAHAVELTYLLLAQKQVKQRFGWSIMTAVVLCRKRNMLTWELEIEKRYPPMKVFKDVKGLSWLMKTPKAEREDCILLWPYSKLTERSMPLLIKLLQETTPGVVIADESTAIKNPKAKRTKAAHDLRKHIYSPVRIMSGNPTPETLLEIWAQYQFAFGKDNPLEDTFYKFCRKYAVWTDYGPVVRFDREKELLAIVNRTSVQFSDHDWAEYRKVFGERTIQYTLELYESTNEQEELLSQLFDDWELQVESGEVIEFSHRLALSQKAQQIASGFIYYDIEATETEPFRRDTHYLHANPKLTLLIDLVTQLLTEDKERRIVVWQLYEAERPGMMVHFEEAGISAVLGPEDDALRAFLLSKGPSVIVMPATTTMGFNELVKADIDIFYSQPYSNETRVQAEARLDRTGQQADLVTHVDLASRGLMDMEIVTALQSKSLTTERLNTIVDAFHRR